MTGECSILCQELLLVPAMPYCIESTGDTYSTAFCEILQKGFGQVEW